MTISRRHFVRNALATTVALGCGRIAIADEARATTAVVDDIVDTHVYIGDWPHASLPQSSAKALAERLRSGGITSAWIGSFDGLFHKDIGGVNQRLAEVCREHGEDLLTPFGTVNLTLPDWEDEVRRCHEDWRMPGIRLHPQYHGYTLTDPRSVRLVALAAERGLIVQLVAWMEDERHRWLSPREAQVDLKSLPAIITQSPGSKLVVANCIGKVDVATFRELYASKQCYFDFGRLKSTNDLTTLIEQVSADRIVFGSATPLHSAETARSILRVAELSAVDRTKIASGNALGLLRAARPTW